MKRRGQQKKFDCRTSQHYEFIYVVTYLPTGKKYVGRTSGTLERRLYNHYMKLKSGTHSSQTWQEDYNKYGGDEDAFLIEFICRQTKHSRCISQIDQEKKTMLLLRTFDERNGYNVQDPSMQRVREAERLYPLYLNEKRGRPRKKVSA